MVRRRAEVWELELADSLVLTATSKANTMHTLVWWHARRPVALVRLGRDGTVRFSTLWLGRHQTAIWHGYWRYPELGVDVGPLHGRDVDLAFRYFWPSPILVGSSLSWRTDDGGYWQCAQSPVVAILRDHPIFDPDPVRRLALLRGIPLLDSVRLTQYFDAVYKIAVDFRRGGPVVASDDDAVQNPLPITDGDPVVVPDDDDEFVFVNQLPMMDPLPNNSSSSTSDP